VDNVGNKEAAKTLSVYTISTPPHTTIMPVGKNVNMGGINYANAGFQLQLSVQDNLAGTDHIEVKVDGDGDYHQYVGPIAFRKSGLHTVSYRSMDRTGNVEPAKMYTVNIIDTLPETKLSMAQPMITRDGVTYSPAPNIVTLNVTDLPGVGIDHTMYSVNDGPWTPYTGPITLTNDEKIYKLSYKSIDRLGNEEQVKNTVVHMMRTVPVVDLFVTDGHSAEEQVRTNYLDQGAAGAGAATSGDQRGPSSAAPADAQAKHKKKSKKKKNK
jgi:hypothetical protein